ncbi:hypothetical protein Tco_1334818 [Tanacetum coccineum]
MFCVQTLHAMVLEDQTRWKLRRRQWTSTTEQLIEDLKSAYGDDLKPFCLKLFFLQMYYTLLVLLSIYEVRYPGRVYVNGHVDIFDMVDIDLFTVVALNMMVVKLEHGVTALDSYIRPPRFRATIEDITDEPGSIATNRTEKMLLLTWNESSKPTKEPVCDSVTPSSLPQHDSSTPCKDSVCKSITPSHVLPTIQSHFNDINMSFVSQQATASQVIDDVMRKLSFEET